MIKKLRRRFILITMLSVSLVLLVIMGTINYLNYRNVVKDADAILSMLRDFDGSFPGLDGGFGPGGPGPAPGDPSFDPENADFAPEDTGFDQEDADLAPEDTGFDQEDADFAPEDTGFDQEGADSSQETAGFDPESAALNAETDSVITNLSDAGDLHTETYENWGSYQRRSSRNMKRGFGGIGGEFSAETPFESRYFSVKMDAEGTVLSTDTTRIAAVNEEEAAGYAESVYAAKRTTGFSGWYRFLKYEKEDGTISILFLDCQRSLADFRSFLLISVLVSVGGFAAVLFLVILLSGRAVRPVQESYEKQKRFITDAGHEL